MVGRSSSEALTLYLAYTQRSLSCISSDVLVLWRDPVAATQTFQLVRGVDEPLLLQADSRLLRLQFRQTFGVVTDAAAARAERWRVRGVGYLYEVFDADSHAELLALHWHPGIGRYVRPHLHVKSAPSPVREAHLPSVCATPARLARLLIEQVGVAPERSDWQRVLDELAQDERRYALRGIAVWTCESDRS